MTLQEVMDAYQITPESAGVTVLDDQSAFRIEGLTLFGVKTDNVLFAFQQADGKLSHVRLAYPNDADMQTVRQQLQTLYGDSVKRHTRLEHDLREATMEETEHFAFWHSATPISGYLNAEDWAAFQRLAQKKRRRTKCRRRMERLYGKGASGCPHLAGRCFLPGQHDGFRRFTRHA